MPSSVPVPLANWLSSEGGEFTESAIYSYDATGKRFNYYHSPLTYSDLSLKLKGWSLTDKLDYILARNSHSRRNAIHFVLSGSLFKADAKIRDQLTLTSEQEKKTTYYQLRQFGDIIETKSTEDTATDNPAIFYENDSKLRAKTINQTIIAETDAILAILLTPFEFSEDALIKLLNSRDKKFHNILLSAFSGTLPFAAFKTLMTFVNKIKVPKRGEETKEPEESKTAVELERSEYSKGFVEFALVGDADGKTIFHYMPDKIIGFCADIFGKGILQKAFLTADYNGYNPLHTLCQSSSPYKLANIKYICQFLHNVTTSEDVRRIHRVIDKEKGITIIDYETMPFALLRIGNGLYRDEDALEKAFDKTAVGGHTPIHLLCMGGSETDITIIEYLRDTFPALFHKQLSVSDLQGNLPSHYAIHTKNLALLKNLFINLDQEQKIQILTDRNYDNCNSVDFVVRYGDSTMLEYIIDLFGLDGFFELYDQSPYLPDLAKQNPLLANKFHDIVNSHIILYKCTAYFMRQLEQYNANTPIHLMRLNDFRDCLQRIKQMQTSLPIVRPEIEWDQGWTFFSVQNEYFNHRKYIKSNMQNQLSACQAYFEEITSETLTGKIGAYTDKDIVTTLFGNHEKPKDKAETTMQLIVAGETTPTHSQRMALA